MKRISGIYKIINKTNNKYYVGKSINIKQRFISHKCELRRNNHDNSRLQKAWNKYGENNFEFKIIEELPYEKLTVIEQEYLNICKQNKDTTYNMYYFSAPTANGFKNEKHTHKYFNKKEINENLKPILKETWIKYGFPKLYKLGKQYDYGEHVLKRLVKEFKKDTNALSEREKNINKMNSEIGTNSCLKRKAKKLSISSIDVKLQKEMNNIWIKKGDSGLFKFCKTKNIKYYLAEDYLNFIKTNKEIKKERKKQYCLTIKNSAVKGENHPRYNHTIYTFYNEKLNISFQGTTYGLRLKFNLKNTLSQVISGKKKKLYGWIVLTKPPVIAIAPCQPEL